DSERCRRPACRAWQTSGRTRLSHARSSVLTLRRSARWGPGSAALRMSFSGRSCRSIEQPPHHRRHIDDVALRNLAATCPLGIDDDRETLRPMVPGAAGRRLKADGPELVRVYP